MIETRFKQTEVGLIPEDWGVTTLGEIMSISSGSTITGNSFVIDGKYPVYGGNGIRGAVNSYNLDGEYILIGRVGALCGNIHITKGKVFASEHALVCNPSTSYCNEFIAPILINMNLGQYSGASAQPVLAAKKISRLKIQFPSPNEQEKIGKALSDIDALVDGLKRLIEKKRAIKQGAMSQLLSGKLRLPGFNNPWKSYLLESVSSYGNTSLPSEMFEDRDYICTDNMLSNLKGVTVYDDFVLTYNVKKYVPYDILLSNIRPYLKKLWFADKSGGCSPDVLIIRPIHEIVYAKFLYYIMSMDKFFSYVMEGISGTKMPRGNKAHIMKYEFPLPQDLAEQETIAEILTDMDKEITVLEAKLKKYEQVKQGMMQQLLTGKIRLI